MTMRSEIRNSNTCTCCDTLTPNVSSIYRTDGRIRIYGPNWQSSAFCTDGRSKLERPRGVAATSASRASHHRFVARSTCIRPTRYGRLVASVRIRTAPVPAYGARQLRSHFLYTLILSTTAVRRRCSG